VVSKRCVEDLNINSAYDPTKLNPHIMQKALPSGHAQSIPTENFLKELSGQNTV